MLSVRLRCPQEWGNSLSRSRHALVSHRSDMLRRAATPLFRCGLCRLLAAYGQTARKPVHNLAQKINCDLNGGSLALFGNASMKPVPIPSRYSVRATIAALLRHGDASLQHTARRLGISPRSLQRQLTRMGTSYSELVAEVRLDTACHLLTESDQSISSIAYSLGYSGASSFSRTFMRLMKTQPAVYRRQQLARRNGQVRDQGNRSAPPGKRGKTE